MTSIFIPVSIQVFSVVLVSGVPYSFRLCVLSSPPHQRRSRCQCMTDRGILPTGSQTRQLWQTSLLVPAVIDIVIRRVIKPGYQLFTVYFTCRCFAICLYISLGFIIIIGLCTTAGYTVRIVYIYLCVRKYS